jgi:mannose-6-phosphate isomerase-like protein (cupin superfamily)
MEQTPSPVSLAAALALPRMPGRSAEVFVDGDLEVRFAAQPTNGPQVPHRKDEIYFVASGTARYRVMDKVTDVAVGDVLFCAAHVPHGLRTIQTISRFGYCSTGQRNRACASPGVSRHAQSHCPADN